jgi:hypothetical protein
MEKNILGSCDNSPSAMEASPAPPIPAHTPGPWRSTGYQIFSGTVLVASQPACDPEGMANARLIAAAPDLLEALKFVLSAHGEQLHDAFDDAHKAITKAEGR